MPSRKSTNWLNILKNRFRLKTVTKSRSHYDYLKDQEKSTVSMEKQSNRLIKHSSVITTEANPGMDKFFRSKINYSPIIKQKRVHASSPQLTKKRRLTKQKGLGNLNERFAFVDNQLMDAKYLSDEICQNSTALNLYSTPEFTRRIIYFSFDGTNPNRSNSSNGTSDVIIDSCKSEHVVLNEIEDSYFEMCYKSENLYYNDDDSELGTYRF